MRLNLRISSGLVALGWLLSGIFAPPLSGSPAPDTARTLVHLLDYIAQDYSLAVSGGQVVSEAEYAEMQEFCRVALSLRPDSLLPEVETEIQKQLLELQLLVQRQASPEAVARLARQARSRLIRAAGIPVAPVRWPDRARGRELFRQNCVACHGPDGRGDGPSAATLDPRPTSFHDPGRMATLSPFQAFNTIRLGVSGTGMAGFPQLTDEEAWALAFYVVSFRHETGRPKARSGSRAAASDVPLSLVAALSDAELEERLAGTSPRQKRAALAALRLASGTAGREGDSLATAEAQLSAALDAYQSGEFGRAKEAALMAYLEGVEPAEPRLRALNANLVAELERDFGVVRRAIERREPFPAVAARVQMAQQSVVRARALLGDRAFSPGLVFSLAVAIILREGFEAILVIVAILGVVRAAGAHSAARWVHGGWLWAIALGALAWIFSDWVTSVGALQRELMEAVASLVAVVVLLSVGFWLHSKTEIGRWKSFIETRVQSALEGRNRIGLALISFLAVFREAVETVLFLSALGIQGGPGARTAMLLGLACALVLVFLLAWALLRFSARIPIRSLFAVSSCLMGILAVILTGKGLHALQESGFLPMTAAPFSFRWDLIGFYPTIETLLFQGLILALSVGLWLYARRPSNQFSPEIS